MKNEINVEQRVAQARKFFENGLNCAQSVAMAYADLCEVDEGLLERMTLALGGGLGRQREVCGTVSGASVVLGMVASRGLSAGDAKKKVYHLVQDFGGSFRGENGSIVCRELLGLAVGEDVGGDPSERTASYYRRRPCGEYVASSARILGNILNSLYLETCSDKPASKQ